MSHNKFCTGEPLLSQHRWVGSPQPRVEQRPTNRTTNQDSGARHTMSRAIGCPVGSKQPSTKSTLPQSEDSIEGETSSGSRQAANKCLDADIHRHLDYMSEAEAGESTEGDSPNLVRQKCLSVINSLLTNGFDFSNEVIRQIQSKIDIGESPFLREKITLKILKTKLRKSKRKDKSKITARLDGDTKSSKVLERIASAGETYYQTLGLTHRDVIEAEQILHKLISVSEKTQEHSKPGEHLLSLISPSPKGLYWINNVKVPEIKSIWRRRLLKEHLERRPEGWPLVVPPNYRLNINKRPLTYRSWPLGITSPPQ